MEKARLRAKSIRDEQDMVEVVRRVSHSPEPTSSGQTLLDILKRNSRVPSSHTTSCEKSSSSEGEEGSIGHETEQVGEGMDFVSTREMMIGNDSFLQSLYAMETTLEERRDDHDMHSSGDVIGHSSSPSKSQSTKRKKRAGPALVMKRRKSVRHHMSPPTLLTAAGRPARKPGMTARELLQLPPLRERKKHTKAIHQSAAHASKAPQSSTTKPNKQKIAKGMKLNIRHWKRTMDESANPPKLLLQKEGDEDCEVERGVRRKRARRTESLGPVSPHKSRASRRCLPKECSMLEQVSGNADDTTERSKETSEGVMPLKRGRGRPRKFVGADENGGLPKSPVANDEPIEGTLTIDDVNEAPPRRGRPPKSDDTNDKPMLRRGRPPKNPIVNKDPPPRRGRPPKNLNANPRSPKAAMSKSDKSAYTNASNGSDDLTGLAKFAKVLRGDSRKVLANKVRHAAFLLPF